MMFSAIPRLFFRPILRFPLLLILLPTATLAQDNSAFLDCARHSDRGQRIACLEDALEDATSRQSRPVETAPEPATSPVRPERANPQAAVAGGSEDRVSSFGREPRIEENEEGREELHETVAALQQPRPNQWLITLGSGQTWYQVHTRRYNLREGDEVRIYSSDWGKNYRLETPRLSGFIQVRRVE